MFRAALGALVAVLGCTDDIIPSSPDVALTVGDAMPGPDLGSGADAAAPDSATPDSSPSADSGLSPDTGDPSDSGAVDVGFSSDAAPAGDTGTACDEVAVARLNASDLAGQAGTFDGRIVTVVGTATSAAPQCTTRPCPVEDPCCNDCTASLRIGAADLIESVCFTDVGCSGNECTLSCAPATALELEFRGILRAGPPIQLELIAIE